MNELCKLLRDNFVEFGIKYDYMDDAYHITFRKNDYAKKIEIRTFELSKLAIVNTLEPYIVNQLKCFTKEIEELSNGGKNDNIY